MSLKHLLNADAGLSVLLHALKAVVALFVNWLVLHQFAVDDFVVWSVTSSILIVATASDLGIGQYTTTRLIAAPREDWPLHIGLGLGALLPLAGLSGLFVLVALDGPSTLYSVTMAALLALRILTLPFVAVLHADNQFKIRKALELGAYLVAAAAVGGIAVSHGDIYLALLLLNASFLLGFVLMIVASARYVSVRASLKKVSLTQSARVFRAALPFTMNNLAGVLAYGGFIWLSSLILQQEDVAKLAVLHTFVLVNLYQIYDVFLKARQADLADSSRLAPYSKLNVLLMLALPPAFLLAGRDAVGLLSGSRLELSVTVAALYGVFVSLELGNLFAQSVIQVDLKAANRLKSYSLIRMTMAFAFLAACLLSASSQLRVTVLLCFLAGGSLVSLLYLQWGRDETSIKKTMKQSDPHRHRRTAGEEP